MARPAHTLLLATALALGSVPAAHAQPQPPPVAELRNGKWQPVTRAAASRPAPDPTLDHMQQLLDVGDAAAALNVGVDWVHGHDKKAPNRDRALLLLAQAKFQLGERIQAYYYCDELMDEYPDSPLFASALDRQYRIADGYLNGHKDTLLGFPVFDQSEQAVEMLYRIQQRSPGSPLAQRALLRTADYYYATGEYELAHDAYAFYVAAYPRADDVPQVKLRAAFASLAQFRGPRFSATPVLDARAQLADLAVGYPQLAREENIAGILERIDQELANKLFLEADYYRRTGQLVGAVYVYRLLVMTYPASDKLPAAKAALNDMPAWALDHPAPRPGKVYQPTPPRR